MQVTIRLETDEGPKSGFQKAYRIGVVFFYITATRSFHFFFHTPRPVLSYSIVSFFFLDPFSFPIPRGAVCSKFWLICVISRR